jgi:hypothetical protein
MARRLRPSEHRHSIAPQPGGDQIKALAIPSTGEAAGKPESASRMRYLTLASARKRHGLHRAKQLRGVTEVARRPDDRGFAAWPAKAKSWRGLTARAKPAGD